MERVGFIGIGVMGRPMCLNLRKAGFPLTVYARRPEGAGVCEVVAAGATLAESPRAVAESSDVVITMLPDSPEVEEVALGLGPAQGQGVLDGAREGLVVVDMSTIAPSASKRLGAACAARGVAFLDAPVSGGSQGAEAGTLTIMIGGDAAVVERMRPVFAAMGAPENIVHVGSVGTGEVVKLVNQHMCGVIAAASLEALVLGVKAGADVETMARIVGASSGGNWQLANPIRLRAFSGTFEPGFFTDLLVKDLRLVQGLGDELHVPLTLAAVAKQMYEAARAQGYGRDDYTAVVRPLEELTGVEVRSRKSKVESRKSVRTAHTCVCVVARWAHIRSNRPANTKSRSDSRLPTSDFRLPTPDSRLPTPEAQVRGLPSMRRRAVGGARRL